MLVSGPILFHHSPIFPKWKPQNAEPQSFSVTYRGGSWHPSGLRNGPGHLQGRPSMLDWRRAHGPAGRSVRVLPTGPPGFQLPFPAAPVGKAKIPTVFRRFHLKKKAPRAGPAQGCHSDRKRNAGSGGPPPSHLKSLQQLGGKRPRQLPDRKPDIADARQLHSRPPEVAKGTTSLSGKS